MKYLIWDFDGTLGYRTEGWTAVLTKLAQQETGATFTAEELRPYLQRGFPWHEYMTPHTDIKTAEQWWGKIELLFAEALTICGVNTSDAKKLAEEVRQMYPKPEYWKLYPDVLPALDKLSAEGWRHVILSNHIPELSQILTHLRLDGHIARVFNSAETGYEKPHPQAYKNVMDFIGSGATAWMIGDNIIADVRGAEAVGLPAILVRKENTEAKHFCRDLTLLSKILA